MADGTIVVLHCDALQTEDQDTMMLDVSTQSDSLLLLQNEDLSLDQGTLNLVNIGMSLDQAHNIRTAVCILL